MGASALDEVLENVSRKCDKYREIKPRSTTAIGKAEANSNLSKSVEYSKILLYLGFNYFCSSINACHKESQLKYSPERQTLAESCLTR